MFLTVAPKEIQVVIGNMKEIAFKNKQIISSSLVAALWSQELLFVIGYLIRILHLEIQLLTCFLMSR